MAKYIIHGGFGSAAAHMNVMMDGIKGIRNMRAEMNVPMGKRSEVILVPATEELKGILETHGDYFHTLGWAEKVTVRFTRCAKTRKRYSNCGERLRSVLVVERF